MAAPECSPVDWQWMPGEQLLLKTSFGEVLTTPPPLPPASLVGPAVPDRPSREAC